MVYSFCKPHTTPRTIIPHPSAKLLILLRLLRMFCCWSQRGDVASETPLMKLIFCFLNAFLRKQNNTHKYLRNSRLCLHNKWQQMSEFKDRFLWIDTVDVFFEFLVLAHMIYSGSCHGAQAHDREPPTLRWYLFT